MPFDPAAREADYDPAPLHVRLLAAVPATAAACAAAPLPAMAWIGVQFGPAMPAMHYPAMVLLTLAFAGPFALAIMLALAAADLRSVSLHVGLGAFAVLLASVMFGSWFAANDLLGVLMAGGALGGLVAIRVREAIETPRAAGLLPKRGSPG